MDTLQIVFQILSALMIIVAILQKDKWKMMLFYTISSILFVAMYIVFNRTASAWICVVSAIRNFIYMFYAYKKIKPNLAWLIIFEVAFLVATILTWQDAFDLMPLFATLAACFGSWQDNQVVLRVAYIINKLLYTIYSAIIGAYISMSIESVAFIFAVISFIYYCLLKQQTPILQVIFKGKAQSAEKQEEKQETNLQRKQEENAKKVKKC